MVKLVLAGLQFLGRPGFAPEANRPLQPLSGTLEGEADPAANRAEPDPGRPAVEPVDEDQFELVKHLLELSGR